MSNMKTTFAACAIASGLTGTAQAHFQLVAAGDANIRGGQALEMILAFTHPAAGDPVMEMGQPEGFYILRQAGDTAPERLELAEYLEPITFHGTETKAAAFKARIPGSVTRGLGDYVFVLEPAPYFEAEEDKYIQQITKLVLNVGGVPGNWAEPQGLRAEIVPLDKPYGVWAGGVFRGVVMADGQPVPFAEIEVEHINYAIDAAIPGWTGKPLLTPGYAVMETQSLRADANGTVVVSLPKAGWWGIGALGVGVQSEHNGKELSQDAVIWVQALPLPE